MYNISYHIIRTAVLIAAKNIMKKRKIFLSGMLPSDKLNKL